MNSVTSYDPGRGHEFVGTIPCTPPAVIEAAVKSAHRAFSGWANTPVSSRVDMLRPLMAAVETNRAEIETLVRREIGKTVQVARSTLDRFLEDLRWSLDNAEDALAPHLHLKEPRQVHEIEYSATGVAAVIAPWNHPFGMFVWGVIPNLLVGNPVVFKHSELCPLSAKWIEDKMSALALPTGVFSQIYGDADQGTTLLEQEIELVWFTGSTEVGRQVYEAASKRFARVVLEMGGSNPAVVLSDANPAAASEKVLRKRFYNCGQACDAVKRVFVHRDLHDQLVADLQEGMQSYRVGLNEDPSTDIGSLASRPQLERLASQVDDARAQGATIYCGGGRAVGLDGAFYLPTLVGGLSPAMRLWTEEAFGPVLTIHAFDNENEAVRLANEGRHGLGAVVFGEDQERAREFASRLRVGSVEIGDANHWHPANPFGGMKGSGIGREHGVMGLRQLCETRLVSTPIV